MSTKLRLAWQLYEKNATAEFYENPTNGLIVGSVMDDWTDGRTWSA
jgi:hypothetical protein